MKEKFPISFVVVIIILLVIIAVFYRTFGVSKDNKTESSVNLPVAESDNEDITFHSTVPSSTGVHEPPKGWSIDGKGGGSMTPGPKGPVPGQKNK